MTFAQVVDEVVDVVAQREAREWDADSSGGVTRENSEKPSGRRPLLTSQVAGLVAAAVLRGMCGTHGSPMRRA